MPFSLHSSNERFSYPSRHSLKPLPSARWQHAFFVEQRVVKSDARVSDGRVVRHERAFAEICRAFVHRNHGTQQIFVLFRTDVNDFSVLESHAEIFDKFPAIRQRSCCDDFSVGVAAHGRREHFFAWNIRVVFDSFKRVFFAAKEVAAVDKPHSEIGAV